MLQQFLLGFLLITLNACSAQKETTMKTFNIENFNKKIIGTEYEFTDTDGSIVIQKERQLEYKETILPKNSHFQTINRYYRSGRLKSTVKYFPNNFLAGTKKEYDEEGKLIKETNYDAPYKFTWENILEFIKEHEIDMNGDHFRISRNFGYGKENVSDKEPFWSITHTYKNKYLLKVLIIDGLSGKIIDKYDQDYPEDGEYDTLPDMENE